jgi:hypothetical protein
LPIAALAAASVLWQVPPLQRAMIGWTFST